MARSSAAEASRRVVSQQASAEGAAISRLARQPGRRPAVASRAAAPIQVKMLLDQATRYAEARSRHAPPLASMAGRAHMTEVDLRRRRHEAASDHYADHDGGGPGAGAGKRAGQQHAAPVATLVTDTDAVPPGKPFRVALRLRLAPGWHTYWHNPGDAGVAPSLTIRGRHAVADRLADAAPRRRGAGDDLRLYRRGAAAGDGHRPQRVPSRRMRSGWCARTSACRRKAISP